LEANLLIEDLGAPDADLADDQSRLVRDGTHLAVVATAKGADDIGEMGRILCQEIGAL
jgi:hypothetical protein